MKIGIIGGSGLSNLKLMSNIKEVKVDTVFGSPSDVLLTGHIEGVDCVLLARHGRQHTISPSNVNYRANLLALKTLGCTHVIVSTACGSLAEHVKPGEFVVIDQFIDRTTKREQTFYDGKHDGFEGILHLPMDTPFCSRTRDILIKCVRNAGCSVHENGTMVTIEGPRFGTKAESKMHQIFGGHVVNMTTVPEVILAKELGLCYAAIAIVTDYDCWKEDREPVSVDIVMAAFKKNSVKAIEILTSAVREISSQYWTETIKDRKADVQKNILLPH